MKEKLRNLKPKLKDIFSEYFILYIIFFVLYLFLGLCISYKVHVGNTFFGSDNWRAFGDATQIKFNHYRIKVHPLFLLLIQPITLFITGITNESTLSVIIEEAICGSLSVCFLYAILKRLNISKILRTILSIIYGFSFSILVFSTVPETFIYAGLGLMIYWYIVTYLIGKNGDLSNKERFLLIFFGIFSFGITLTNYISYFIGLLLVLICRYDFKKDLKKIIKELFLINFISLFFIGILCIFQKFVWKDCPIFLRSILDGLTGKEKYEETLYMNWLVNFDKTKIWVKNILFYPFLSPSVQIVKDYIGFSIYNFPLILKIIIRIFVISLFIPVVVTFVKRFFAKKDKNFYYFIFVFLTLLYNILLHYIYGYSQAFLYSPHYIFLYLILLAISINEFRKNKIPYIYYIFRFNIIFNF